MIEKKSKVINTQNNIIGIVVTTAGDKAWVYEHGGGDHIFEISHLEVITSVKMKPKRITSDRSHAEMLVNGKVILENLEPVVQECVDLLEKFLQ